MLPTNVLLQIAEYLPASSKVFFSHNCIGLRNGLGLPTLKQLPLADRIDYAGVLAKHQTDVRACPSCGSLHAVRKHDSPTVRPRLKITFTGHDKEDCRSMYEHKFPGDRHIQLALKYTRLGTENPKHKKILEGILQPFMYASLDVYARVHHLRRWKWCKIVDGHFLAMTKWTIGRFYHVGPKNAYGLAELLQPAQRVDFHRRNGMPKEVRRRFLRLRVKPDYKGKRSYAGQRRHARVCMGCVFSCGLRDLSHEELSRDVRMGGSRRRASTPR